MNPPPPSSPTSKPNESQRRNQKKFVKVEIVKNKPNKSPTIQCNFFPPARLSLNIDKILLTPKVNYYFDKKLKVC
jgi:hypothetical protein